MGEAGKNLMSRTLTILALFLTLAGAAAAQQAGVRDALDQMGGIERQIDGLRRSQWEERNQIVTIQGSLESIEKRLSDKTSLRAEGERFLKNYQTEAARQAARIDRQMEDDLLRMRAARKSLALTGAAMQRAANDPLAAEADRLALALLWRDRHQVAAVSANRLLRMESQRAQLIQGREQAGQVARQHSVFALLSEQELSEKHRQLAAQLAAIQGRIGRSEEEIKTLAGRREELRALMARLVEGESKTAAVATPSPSPAPTATPSAEQKLAAAGPQTVANENQDAPLVSRESDSSSSDGTRQLFWRAEPIGVRALGSGRVVFAEPFAGYRNLLIVDHGGGWRTLYGNLSSCAVKAGAQVSVGDVIGRYQSSEGDRAEPFWLEVRQGVAAMRPDQWPALPTAWERNLFSALR